MKVKVIAVLVFSFLLVGFINTVSAADKLESIIKPDNGRLVLTELGEKLFGMEQEKILNMSFALKMINDDGSVSMMRVVHDINVKPGLIKVSFLQYKKDHDGYINFIEFIIDKKEIVVSVQSGYNWKEGDKEEKRHSSSSVLYVCTQ